jgi:deoxyhypusine synthase
MKNASTKGPIGEFILHHYRHFNAASVKDAAMGWEKLLEGDGKMFVTLAGAMSTAEIGLSLAEMIRKNKVHAISCTGANLEEDVFNLVAHEHYVRLPHYRELSPDEEQKLKDRDLNRVTDTCIPEHEAMRRVEKPLIQVWQEAEKKGEARFPHEFLYEVLRRGLLKDQYQIDPKNSWLLAAAEKNLPMFVPGWEDSTTANFFAARVLKGEVKSTKIVKPGIDYMVELIKWYRETSAKNAIGFFQIGGGIAGDFPICVVPLINDDLEIATPLWSYFCQISDSTTSYGSYSGAVPNEKISWGKLSKTTPKYVIESDATIVAPLIFGYLLGW